MSYNPYNPTVKSFTGEINQIEKALAKYLFRKYLVPPNTLETKDEIRARREIFLQGLFPTRPETIEQSDELIDELDNITRATEEYARCPDDYPTGRTQWGYPDSLRCKHICYVRHRFTRCACKINMAVANQSRPFCVKHLAEDNPHVTEYSRLASAINTLLLQQQQAQLGPNSTSNN